MLKSLHAILAMSIICAHPEEKECPLVLITIKSGIVVMTVLHLGL